MPAKLTTTIKNIDSIPNTDNITIVKEFHQYMKDNGASERHQNNNLKAVISFAKFLGSSEIFYNIQRKEQIISFLDTKVKSLDIDPDKKWIVTWNDYLHRIKHFIRWLYNQYGKKEQEETISQSEWQTPSFARIKEKKTKRLTSYSETEIWDREELLTIVKAYVRDWLNRHPFKNTLDARLICNMHNGAPVKPEAMWTMMQQLRIRIARMIENGSITDNEEKEKLEYLLKTKKWNPYCIRHSAITSDSDFLPEYALKKKVRWSMNSKQGSRYIKRRMGNDLKQKILVQNGIISEQQIERKLSVLNCPRCSLVNTIENKYCSKCSYPLVPSAFDEIKAVEDEKIQALETKYEQVNSALQNILTVLGSVNQAGKNEIAKQLIQKGVYRTSTSS